MKEKGNHEEAIKLIEETKNTQLTIMLGLFQKIYLILRYEQKEIAIVLQSDGRECVLVVDEMEAVEHLAEEKGVSANDYSAMASLLQGGLVSGIQKRARSKELVQILDLSQFL